VRALTLEKNLQYQSNHPAPRAGEGECLVRVRMAGICSTDLQLVKGYMQFRGILGHEFVGLVESGSATWQGKRVVCEINCVCRRCDMCLSGLANHCRKRTVLGISGRDGCFADLVCVPESNLHEVPDALTDEQAVFVEPVAAAYQTLSQYPFTASTKATVVGSGRLGLLVAQVLSATGCKLTVIGRNAAKLSLAEKRGVQAVHVDELACRADHDVVVDCTGTPAGFDLATRLVRPRGSIVLKSTFGGVQGVNLAAVVVNEISVLGSRCGSFSDAINALVREAVEVRPMITQTVPFERAMEAMAAAGQAKHLKILLDMRK